ncbi:glutamate N-acetyltransferase/amino-acid N-acetyltransferase [Elusimicrobium posterum]|uniref:bifunctional glutamate N-acetyltransferase/amino-acid acetyltransferase ArgJ n=1 Tax=Elusimicrobium posterum TaxID=3116653 RepID=UPI003C74A5A3
MKVISPSVTAPKGFKAAGIHAGLKKSTKKDLAVIISEVPAVAGAVFTLNKMAAAPVWVCRENLKSKTARAVIVNSGSANACTGERGLNDAWKMAALTAKEIGCAEREVFVSSTGVIGAYLNMEKMEAGIKDVVKKASSDGGKDAALAIMTTDTTAKEYAVTIEIDGIEVTVAGIAKGSGMIAPNMATMLSYVTTDVNISKTLLQKAVKNAADESFNLAIVDGDTSTNDTLVVLANGMSGNKQITREQDRDYKTFYEALKTVCTELAKMMVKDGEGATKFIQIEVQGAQTSEEARVAATTVAKSPLVKTAFFGQDANWGRMVCALGYSGINLIPERLNVWIDNVHIFKNGTGLDADEKILAEKMAEHEIHVIIDLGRGDATAKVWTCDFSYDYVKINGSYRS